MGSRSDWETLQHAVAKLDLFGIASEVRVVSAHRTPDLMFEFAEHAATRGFRAIIAGAGGQSTSSSHDILGRRYQISLNMDF